MSEGATERPEMAGPATDVAGLAPVHGQVLALRDAGLSAAAIAAIVGVAVESVPVLIEVAARKRAKQVHTPNPRRPPDEHEP